VTCQGVTFSADLVGPLKVNSWIACWGFNTVDSVDRVANAQPTPVFISVFSFKPADEISIVEIEQKEDDC
jgi:hypothetical protein